MAEVFSVCGKDVSGYPCMRVSGHAPPCLSGYEAHKVDFGYDEIDIAMGHRPKRNTLRWLLIALQALTIAVGLQIAFDILVLIKVF